MKATEYLMHGIKIMEQRAKDRNPEASEERQITATRKIYEAIQNKNTIDNDYDGWMWMAALKLARAQNGFNQDDYIDGINYLALAAESRATDGEKTAGNDNDYFKTDLVKKYTHFERALIASTMFDGKESKIEYAEAKKNLNWFCVNALYPDVYDADVNTIVDNYCEAVLRLNSAKSDLESFELLKKAEPSLEAMRNLFKEIMSKDK